MAQSEENGWRQSFRSAGPYLGIGFQLAIAVVVFYYLGSWVDREYETGPFGMIVGSALGFAGGMIKFIRTVTSKQFQHDVTGDDGRR